MSKTTIVNNRRREIGYQKKNLKMVSMESTPLATNERDFSLADTEKTFQTETKSKSYGVNNNGLSKWVRLIVTFFGRILSWLNGFGGSAIDVHQLENRHSQQPGFRKWNL
jgi:hypothetical protein